MVKFTKMHTLGNDFLVINGLHQEVELPTDWVRFAGDRHRGIGFDQLLCIKAVEGNSADFELAIYNNDGNLAQQCGNGTLCVARFVSEEKLTSSSTVGFKTLGGIVKATVLGPDVDGNTTVRADLGIPTTEPNCVPFVADSHRHDYEIDLELESMQKVRLIPVGMGNPHAVVFESIDRSNNLEAIAHAIQIHERFPDSVNVEFVEIVDRSLIRLRVFERGVGETMACGTGACAAVTAAKLAGYVDSRVSVDQVGGTVSVEWSGPDHPISLTAATSRVFDGEIHLD